MSSLIEFKHVSLKFGQKIIFENFNLEIKKNDKIVVFGKSGLGKSTLLKLILGFQTPAEGEILFKGQKITPKNIWQIRQQMAYVDQDVMLGEGITREVIQEYLSLKANQNLTFKKEALVELLEKFGLAEEVLDKQISELSGGERQRLGIAIALLLERSILIFDEVTASLDPQSKDLVIQELLKRKDTTLLVVTHDREWQSQRGVKIFDFKEKKWQL